MTSSSLPPPRRRTPLALFAAVLALMVFSVLWLGWVIYGFTTYASHESGRAIRLIALRGEILRLDEVLTMSARMSTATGDPAWERRYQDSAPLLDKAIGEALALSPGAAATAAAQTAAANSTLVAMEEAAIALVRGGRKAEGAKILGSGEYERHKRLYSAGMSTLAAVLTADAANVESAVKTRSAWALAVVALIVPVLLVFGGAALRATQGWQEALLTFNRELDAKVAERTSDLTAEVAARRAAQTEAARARDAALEAARAKAEFMANMSHEIRTPMNAIIGLTGLLRDTPLDAQQREFVTTIQNAGDALLSIINDILDFSKFEAGKMSLELVAFDLRDVVEGAVELVAGRGQSKGLEVASFVDPRLASGLRGDPGRLRQVLTNLLANAVKFTERGEVTVFATRESVDGGRMAVRFVVTDTGIGIPAQAQARLFEAFSQADGSTTRKYGGTGLGLAISKKIVTLMGGAIGLESAPGKGSSFWFTVLFEAAGEAPPDAMGTADADAAGIRILVVDDNATNRTILTRQLDQWRFRNSAADGAEAALTELRSAAARGEPYRIALVDMQMPGVDGLELARRIKADAALAPTKLVMMTSMGLPAQAGELRAAGLDDWLVKPVKQSQLFDSLIRVVAGRGAQAVRRRDAAPTGFRRDYFRVLLAEDNEVNRTVALLQLRKLGYSADVAHDGREALDAMSNAAYDLVLMDCQMPVLDGYEAAAEARLLERGGRRTPIAAMTANALEGDRDRCLKSGMDDYLCKPVRLEDLAALLARWDPPLERERRAAAAASPLRGEATRLLAGLRADVQAARYEEAARKLAVLDSLFAPWGARGMKALLSDALSLARAGSANSLLEALGWVESESARVWAALESPPSF